jgi:hypothetical protein
MLRRAMVCLTLFLHIRAYQRNFVPNPSLQAHNLSMTDQNRMTLATQSGCGFFAQLQNSCQILPDAGIAHCQVEGTPYPPVQYGSACTGVSWRDCTRPSGIEDNPV